MRCNWWRWLWGIIPLLVLSWVAVQAEHGRMERDLSERGRLALAAGGLNWAMAEFKGRDAVLTGRAPQEGDPARAGEALGSLYGVRVIDNRTTLLDKAEKYVWVASRRNNRIRLTGYAPSINARQAILGVTKASFPGFELVDRTTLARGVPATDVWLAGVSFALKQLTSLKRGDVRLEDLTLTINGEAEDIPAYRSVKQALVGGLPRGISVNQDNVTPPIVSPFTWSAQMTQGRLVLAGYVPSDAAREQIIAGAKAGLPATLIEDRMEPGEGAPQGWTAAAVAALKQLAQLEGGGAELKDTVLTVSGLAPEPAAAEAMRTALRGAMPPSIRLNDQIKAREPPAAPPPPQAPAPEASIAPPAPKEPAPPVATVPDATAPPPRPEAVIKARACEEKLSSLAVSGTIIFALSSAELESASFPTLDKLADAAKTCPGMQIEVAGHASAEGNPELNQQLSLRRAQSVVAYLVNAGVEAARLQPIGYGSTRPVAPNDTSENMAKNRRIEFAVRPK